MGTRLDFSRFAATAFASNRLDDARSGNAQSGEARFDKARLDKTKDSSGDDKGNDRVAGRVDVGIDNDIDVGEGYYAVGPDLLIEKGDEYLHPSGRFIPFPLEAVGRPVSRGLLARRMLSRRPSQR